MAAAVSNSDEKNDNTVDLFTPIQCGDNELKNRIAMAPMTRGRATEQFVPTDIMTTYYEQRASVGLIITEGTGISVQGLGWYRAPGVWTDEMVEKWKPVTDAVHKKGGLIACQLWHLGRQAHSATTGVPTVSASALALPGQTTTVKGVKKDHEVPHSPSEEEIKGIIGDYTKAADNSIKAGFDYVELHGANGYLIDQFLQSVSNERTDQYGGNIENRLRFMQECINGVLTVLDAKQVGIRLSPNGAFGGMGSEDSLELFDAAITWLAGKKLAFIHVMDGLSFGFHKKTEPYTNERAMKIIKSINKETLLISNVGYTYETGTEAVSQLHTDLVAYGRPLISNPDLVYRFKNKLELAATAEHDAWWGWQRQGDGYIDFPTYEEEQAKKKEKNNNDNHNKL